jgi:hypothetical protein
MVQFNKYCFYSYKQAAGTVDKSYIYVVYTHDKDHLHPYINGASGPELA